MKTVLLFGTFDFLHSGHLHVFMEAKELGDRLFVSVASDAAVQEIKGNAPIHTQQERLSLVQHIDIVDTAFIGDETLGSYSFFAEFVPDVIALGHDQSGLEKNILSFIQKHGYQTKLVSLSRYKDGVTRSSTIKANLGI